MKQIKLPVLLFLFLLSGFLIFFDGKGFLSTPKSVLQIPLVPLQKATYNQRSNIDDTFSTLTFWRSGEARIKNLEQRNLELLYQTGDVEHLRQENKDLRAQLGTKSLLLLDQLPAQVLGSGRYLVIGMGSDNGVKEGQNVVYLDNLVGVVKSVTNRTSFVQLPTDAASRISVKSGTSQLTHGIANGQFNSAILLDQVAQNEELNVDELVVTAGDDQKFQPNLVVGRIKKIISSETDLFRRAEIAPLIRYDELRTVFVILN